MKIKIQCDCGSKFSFEIEPVNGQMPVVVNCPSCNRDGTAAANAEIARQQAETPPPPAPQKTGRLRVSSVVSAPTAAAAPAAEPAAQAAEGEERCPRHLTELAAEHCRVCGKAICLKCMEQYGYVCSHYCREQADARKLDIPIYANQTSYKFQQSKIAVQRAITAVIAFIVICGGVWVWYTWFARNPKVVYSVDTYVPESRNHVYYPKEFFRLIAPDLVLKINTNKLTLLNVTAQTDVWSVDLPKTPKEDSDQHAFWADDDYFPTPDVTVTPADIWLWFPDRLLRIDRSSGAIKTPINGRIESVKPSESALLVVSHDPAAVDKTLLTRIALPDGAQETATVSAANEKKAVPVALGRTNAPAGNKRGEGSGAAGQVLAGANRVKTPSEAVLSFFDRDVESFYPSGSSVVQFQTDLLEAKYIEHQAMKAKGKSVVESANLSAGQGMDAANEIFNDMQRQNTGGIEREDVSRYKVTVRRHFAKDVADWSGEMEGPPRFFALKTVDLVGAGHTLIVLDKNNKKLWETKLTYNVRGLGGDRGPCLETRDSLYFADEGVLARFDLTTGAPKWRMPTVGVSKLVEDGKGSLYVCTTTAGPETIRYSQEVNFKKQIQPILLKVDIATGKSLWNREVVTENCELSGKFVYSSRLWETYELLNLEDGPKARYDLNLVNPSSGGSIWKYHQNNRTHMRTEIRDNWILVQFQDKMVVMKFFSL